MSQENPVGARQTNRQTRLLNWAHSRAIYFETLFVLLLAGIVRLTDLGVFRAIDEEDRWRWATEFYWALLAGNLPATLVGDGYPGIFPVWIETIWLFSGSLYRSVLSGGWIGEGGVYAQLHAWERWSSLAVQRFPVVLVNTLLVVIVFLYARKLFGQRVALLSAIFISLDPFYLSDSRVNRAEALVAGLMTLSLLALLVYLRGNNRRQLVFSVLFGGFAWLTKLQALVLLPMLGAITLLWYLRAKTKWQTALRRWFMLMLVWSISAALVFVILWPAVWTVPGDTFALMSKFLTRKVGEEGVKLFFLGRTVLDQDPGLLFYPVILILRISPLTLVGLLLGLWPVIAHICQNLKNGWRAWLDDYGVWTLLAFALLYAGGMSLGSHKHDRFLMTIFPVLNILAALAYVYVAQKWKWPSRRYVWAGVAMLVLSLLIALPYHPYYFSYFNPLVGGGRTAVKLTRIGWGEGMDQVADYLNTLENPEALTVATRFNQYLLGYQGDALNLDQDGVWVRADKIIFYIQQSQRMLDPSPGVIRYFQQHVPPEKTIVINGIEYAVVYPNPIAYPADPQIDRIEDQLALYGYRWAKEPDGAEATLIWENMGFGDGPLAVRLRGHETNYSDWFACDVNSNFNDSVSTLGEIVESNCRLTAGELPPGLYSLQVGIQDAAGNRQVLDFAGGRSTIQIESDGSLARVSPEVAFAKLADETIPPDAVRLEHAYGGEVRLLAYQLSPAVVNPGQSPELTLYWQAPKPLDREIHVTVQAFLGDERIVLLNGEPSKPTESWQPGEVIIDRWTIPLNADLPAPALLRLDVGLFYPDTLVPLQAHDLTGQHIPGAIARIRLEPEMWQTYRGEHPLNFVFGNAVKLTGYEMMQVNDSGAVGIDLYWEAKSSLDGNYTAFVHLLNSDGSLAAQSDVLPANGFYPTSAWQEGDAALSHHTLSLTDLPSGDYRFVAGLYLPENWERLPGSDTDGTSLPDNAAPLGEITIE